MNGIALQLVASTIALGLMGGAAGVHYLNVKSTTANEDREDALYENMALASYEQPVSSPQEGGSEDEQMLKAFELIVSELEKLNGETRTLKEENSQLQEQVAEANRDLSLLRLRVDSHSESFRPLRIHEDSTFQKAIPVHPVLPPKNW